MDTRLLHALLGALHRGWHRGGDALHPDPRPTLLEALRDTHLAAAHTVTQVTRDAERMAYPQFRARLLRMATEAHNSWDALRRELAAGFRRLRETTQQHRAGLLEMLVQSDPYALAWDPAALERARARAPTGPTRLYVAERLAEVARRQHAFRVPVPVAAGG